MVAFYPVNRVIGNEYRQLNEQGGLFLMRNAFSAAIIFIGSTAIPSR